MKLLLTSNGLKNAALMGEFIDNLPINPRLCTVAWIPTASHFKREKSWLHADYQELAASGVQVSVVDIASLPSSVVLEKCASANALWFDGGDPGYLMHWIRESGLGAELPRLLDTRLYVGVSAGSMIAAPDLEIKREFPHEDEIELTDFSACDLVTFVTVPHYNSPDFPDYATEPVRAFSEKVSYPVYGVPEGSAIFDVDGRISMIGSGIEKFESGKLVETPGE